MRMNTFTYLQAFVNQAAFLLDAIEKFRDVLKSAVDFGYASQNRSFSLQSVVGRDGGADILLPSIRPGILV